MGLRLEIRPYAFALRQPLHTAAAVLHQRCGWLLRLEASDGRLGWGEVAPLLPQDHRHCAVWLEARRAPWSAAVAEAELEACLLTAPPPLAFALGAALAELEGLVAPGAWLPPPAPARLLPAGDRMPEAVMSLLRSLGDGTAITLKWKVGVGDATQELQLLERLLAVLPPRPGCGSMPTAAGRCPSPCAGSTSCAATPGWSGWSSPWPPAIGLDISSSCGRCRWPLTRACATSRTGVVSGRGGRCAVLCWRGIRDRCCISSSVESRI